MRIAVDLSFVRPDHTNGGTETCIKNLIKGWIQEGVISDFLFFIHKDIYEDYKKLFPECNFVVYQLAGSHKMRTTLFQTCMLPRQLKKYKADILYYPTYTTGYYRKLSIPVVVNPHDIQFKFYPEYFSWLKRLYLNLGYRHSLKGGDVIIAITDYVKDTLQTHYKQECGNKLLTVYDPVDFDSAPEEAVEDVKEPYILSVSSIMKHKNMLTLIKAFERICEKIPHVLVIVGCRGNGMEEIKAYLRQKGIEKRIIFTDYVTDGQLQWLYSHGDLYVTTSLYEGFGMTPIEAMGRGVPAICSKSTCLPEVTMGLAHYYEPAMDDRALSVKMLEILEGNSASVPDKKIFIERFDKTRIARELYQLFKYSKKA